MSFSSRNRHFFSLYVLQEDFCSFLIRNGFCLLRDLLMMSTRLCLFEYLFTAGSR